MPVPMTEEEQTQAIKDLAKTVHTHPNLGALSNIGKAANGSMTFYGTEMASKIFLASELAKITAGGGSGITPETQTELDKKADLGVDGKVLPEQLPDVSGISPETQTELDAMNELIGNKADLDVNGKVLTSQLPALAICDTFVVNSESAMLALDAQRGDVCVRTDLTKSFILKTDAPNVLANWVELLSPVSAILSVNGYASGAIVLNKTDIGLPNVTNDAQIKALFSGYTEKTAPVAGDWIIINSAADNLPYKVKRSNFAPIVDVGSLEILSYFNRG